MCKDFWRSSKNLQSTSSGISTNLFLSVGGSMGFGSFVSEQRQDLGFYFGAGVDLKMSRRHGVAFTVQQQNGEVTCNRYLVGFYWIHGNLE